MDLYTNSSIPEYQTWFDDYAEHDPEIHDERLGDREDALVYYENMGWTTY